MSETVLGEEVEEYLRLKKRSTADSYRVGFGRFLQYYRARYGEDKGFSDLLNRLDENMRLPRRERKLLAELEVSDFIEHLKRKGYASNTIRLNFTALQNYLKYKGYQLSGRWVGNLPMQTAKKGNSKHRWTLEELREFVGRASNYRDKAIILAMFQSGMGVREICDLDYGDVEAELERGRLPLLVDVVRRKSGVRYKTFLGADAVKYLRLYLETRGGLRANSPLFTKLGSEERVTEAAIQWSFREMAEGLSFIEVKDNSFNPARPHSMRSAFRSRLTGKMDPDLIEFFMGHAVSGTRAPYLNLPDEELRELYAGFEHQLSVETTSKRVGELDGRPSAAEGRYLEKMGDLETALRIQAGQLSQLTEFNSRLRAELEEARRGQDDAIRGLQAEMDVIKRALANPEAAPAFWKALREVEERAARTR